MGRTRRGARPKKKSALSRGAILFKAELGDMSCAAAAEELSALLPAGAETFKRETVWCYSRGKRRPSLPRAAVIERWSEGRIPMGSWLEEAEDASRASSARGRVQIAHRGVLP